jgi:hypothetical protein
MNSPQRLDVVAGTADLPISFPGKEIGMLSTLLISPFSAPRSL